MNKVVWVLVGLIFFTSFMLLQYQQGENACMSCSSMIFPEESQDVETPFVSEVNRESCLVRAR